MNQFISKQEEEFYCTLRNTKLNETGSRNFQPQNLYYSLQFQATFKPCHNGWRAQLFKPPSTTSNLGSDTEDLNHSNQQNQFAQKRLYYSNNTPCNVQTYGIDS